jgi:hypothetical protein
MSPSLAYFVRIMNCRRYHDWWRLFFGVGQAIEGIVQPVRMPADQPFTSSSFAAMRTVFGAALNP